MTLIETGEFYSKILAYLATPCYTIPEILEKYKYSTPKFIKDQI